MNAKTKKLLLIFTCVYVAATACGMAIFRSPGLSAAYAAKYGTEHARYLGILKNEAYRLHEERPALHPLTPELREQAAFVEAYEARPAYQAERRRIAGYTWYFRGFNSIFFIALAVTFARRPMRDFLDGRIAGIRDGFAAAEQEADEGARLQADAQAELDRWPDVERCIRHRADDVLDEELAAIREEYKNSKLQLQKTAADRISAEYLRVARTLQEELVTRALDELKERYRNESSEERQGRNVDQFVRLMDTLS